VSRFWKYQDQGGEYVFDENEILQQYFPHWSRHAQNAGHTRGLTPQNCIDDFAVVHWAAPATEAEHKAYKKQPK
jgi:3-hydroxy-3-methylglutaryl CoA synthase